MLIGSLQNGASLSYYPGNSIYNKNLLLLIWLTPIYLKKYFYYSHRASLIAHLVKNPPAMQETPVQFLGQEDPLEKG